MAENEEASIISLGNCKIIRASDIREIEERKEKAKKYGTCYCLIKPDKEWINPYCMESVVGNCDTQGGIWDLVLPVIGSVNNIIPRPVCETNSHHSTMKWSTAEGKKEGITMLSTLLCTRGGIITIEWSGQKIVEGYVTLEQLINSPLGWSFREIIGYDLETLLPIYKNTDEGREITQADVDEINRVLYKYGINTPDRIAHFLAQCQAETDGGYLPVEKYGGDDIFAYFAEKYEINSKKIQLGNTQPGDGAKYRGAGAIQLTGRSAYEAFSKYMDDPKILSDGAVYVGKEYFWEVAGYYWSIYKPSTANDDTYDLNKKCDENASVEEITRIINGGSNGLKKRKDAYDYYDKVIK